MQSLTDQLHSINNNYLGQYDTKSSSMMSQGYRDSVNPPQRGGFSMGAGYDKATNGGQSFNKSGGGVGNAAMAMGLMNAGKAMQDAMKSTWSPSAESKFSPNMWQDIGGGLQNTGMAGSSMNLYIQKMLSNPAIMQLIQSRMGVSNGS
jgi:hypothetical protein